MTASATADGPEGDAVAVGRRPVEGPGPLVDPKERADWLPFIGWLRVLAILGVVFIHISGQVIGQTSLRGTAVWNLAAVLNGGTRWCVPVFTLVSGALLLNERTMSKGLSPFYRRRMLRLIPPLIFWQAFYLLFKIFVKHQRQSVVGVVSEVLSGRIYTAMYFFWLILGLYLAAPFLWRAVRDLSQRTWLIVGGTLVALTCTWQTTVSWLNEVGAGNGNGTLTIWTYWLPYVGFFVLGGALARRPAAAREALLGGVAFVVGAGISVLQLVDSTPRWVEVLSPFGYYSWFVAMSTIGLWLLVAWTCRQGTFPARGRVGAFGERLGALTLGVFAVHLAVMWFTTRHFAPQLTHGVIGLPAFVGILVTTAVVSWLIAWVMSKVPVLRRLV